MTTNTSEYGFEETIENFLIEKTGYIQRNPENYDKVQCADKELVLEFIKNTQKKTWEEHCKQHGDLAEDKFFKRLEEEIKELGTLEVHRKGIKDFGSYFKLAYFKPSSNLNPEAEEKFQANIFSCIRQVKYSVKNENSIDMVIFLNGLPIFLTLNKFASRL